MKKPRLRTGACATGDMENGADKPLLRQHTLAAVRDLECAELPLPERPIETAMGFEQRIWLPQQASACAKAIPIRRSAPAASEGRAYTP
jgi:hypothetical protein